MSLVLNAVPTPSVRFSTSDSTAVPEQHVAATVASAVGRVLDINPVLLRTDTPLDSFGCDSVALIAIVDALVESGVTVATDTSAALADVVTFGDLVSVIGDV